MKKENAESKPTIESFESALKPYLNRRDEAERHLIALRNGLENYRRQSEGLEKKLARAIESFQNELAEGKNPRSNESLEIRKELENFKAIITDLEKGIKGAEENLRIANVDLIANLKILLVPLRNEFTLRMNQALSVAGAIWDEWSTYLDRFVPSLNLQGLQYWDREELYKLTPGKDKNLSGYLLFLRG